MRGEDGVNAGTRNIGRFFLSLIPWALGIGFMVWFGAWAGVAKYKHDISQERRAAVYVGAETKPEEKIKLDVVKHDCTTISRADVNGSDLMIYARNDCKGRLSYLAWHWQTISPDGTVVGQGYTNGCPIPNPGNKAECKMKIDDDERTATVRIWTSKTTD